MAILVDYIISDVRKNTDNEEYNDTVGFADEEIVRFINDGRNRLHARIIAQHDSAFVEEYTVSTTANLEYYTAPFNAFLNNRIQTVEWSPTGLSADYRPLRKISHKLRSPGLTGDPFEYSIKNTKIYLSPIPTNSTGILRISYIQAPKMLNKRRGQIIATSQCSDSLSAPTFININYVDATNDPTEMARETRFSVVDKYGNIKMSNVLLSSIGAAGTTADATTYEAQLVIDSSTSFNSGDVIAQGYYIVPGKWSSSHIDEPENIIRYIRTHAEVEVLLRDSSQDAKDYTELLATMEQDIIASFADKSDDIDFIPEINEDWTP